jgi:hypothetical protein
MDELQTDYEYMASLGVQEGIPYWRVMAAQILPLLPEP